MYLIEESIEEIQGYFQSEPQIEEIVTAFDINLNSKDSAWQEYVECQHMEAPITSYEIKTPMQLIRKLNKLWEGHECLDDEEFIKTFVVGAYRQTLTVAHSVEGKKEQADITIPSFIYNF